MTFTQNTGGTSGNSTITTDISQFTVVSFSAGGTQPPVTGSLAAVWYVNAGAVVLTGTARDGEQRQGAGVMIKGTDGQFTAKILSSGYGPTATVAKTATFNFNRDSNLFIRKVFNTNPTKTNSEIVASSKN